MAYLICPLSITSFVWVLNARTCFSVVYVMSVWYEFIVPRTGWERGSHSVSFRSIRHGILMPHLMAILKEVLLKVQPDCGTVCTKQTEIISHSHAKIEIRSRNNSTHMRTQSDKEYSTNLRKVWSSADTQPMLWLSECSGNLETARVD